MAGRYISQALRQMVTEAFQRRCAYCMTPSWLVGDNFTIDHIIPHVLGGETAFENLCLACWSCNSTKNDRIVGADPQTGQLVRLYHPQVMQWHRHFSWTEQGIYIVGLTAVGRATISTIQLNRLPLLESRRYWIEAGWHPPAAD